VRVRDIGRLPLPVLGEVPAESGGMRRRLIGGQPLLRPGGHVLHGDPGRGAGLAGQGRVVPARVHGDVVVVLGKR
jgi:hypothetical protein